MFKAFIVILRRRNEEFSFVRIHHEFVVCHPDLKVLYTAHMPHMLVHMGLRGKFSNIKGLLFLRNQGSHLALVWYVDSF